MIKKTGKLPLAALVALAVVIFVLGYLILMSGTLAKPTTISQRITAPADCTGQITVNAELKDDGGGRISDVPIGIYGNEKIDSLYTDRNGRVELGLPAAEWCGKELVIRSAFDGNWQYGKSEASTSTAIPMPTSLTIEIANETLTGRTINATLKLVDSQNQPLVGRMVYLEGRNATTGDNGTATIQLQFDEAGTFMVSAAFQGDRYYSPSSAESAVVVAPVRCGSVVAGECYGSYLCTQDQQLLSACDICGCSGGRMCIDGQCITDEERIEKLIELLQKSNVIIKSDDGIGSGVIVAEKTVLTNRHVVDPDFDGVASDDIQVKNYKNELTRPSRILMAPDDIDLAVIIVRQDIGPPAEVEYFERPRIGANVLVVGSPLGIANSVTEGIISNYVDTNTSSGLDYEALQTDAAVNPGNSGGGVFLSSSGRLVGITSFKLVIRKNQFAEGLGFAVPVRLLVEYPPADWAEISGVR